MNTRRWIALTFFWLLVAAALTALLLTRPQAGQRPAEAAAAKTTAAPKEKLVDESPLQTARRLAPLASSAEELPLAHQAERLATHEVDLAFAGALRQAQANPPTLTPQTQDLLEHRNAGEAAVAAHEKRIAELTRQLAAAPSRDQDALQDQLEVAKAELELNQDEMEQASEALQRAGGDPQGHIQRLKAAHAALAAIPSAPAAPADALPQAGNLLARLQRLNADSAKLDLLRQARQESQARSQTMLQKRVIFSQRVETEGEQREWAKRQASAFTHNQSPLGQTTRDQARTTLKQLQHYMSDQRSLADYGRRIQDNQELEEVYGTWTGLAAVQRRAALHSLLLGLLSILGVVLVVMLADHGFERLFQQLQETANRVGRMLKVVKIATQALGALIIICLVFGLPSQLTTLFGLAGAGLTVAMKDFIMGFFGWFILVGRNGIHVGDWVEISGVGGEVVEIGLLRTILVETGNGSDHSHPTGRIASFVNSFAMEGHFFNFSTAGQWMWDEWRVQVPPDQEPYQFAEGIRKLVATHTEGNAKLAEGEWRKASRSTRGQGFSALPCLNMEPIQGGLEIQVRYITRAYERHDTQRALNQALLEQLHGKPEATLSAP